MFTGVQVAVDNAAFQFDKLYSYNVPDDLVPFAKVGARVLVPFGRSGSRMGIVLSGCEQSDSFKSIIDIERTEPIINKELVEIIDYLKQSTFCTYYDAVKAVLPKNIRLVPDEDFGSIVTESEGHTEGVYIAADPLPDIKLTEKQKAILEFIKTAHTFAEINEVLGVTRETVNRLVEKGAAIRERRIKSPADIFSFASPKADEIELTPAQKAAYDDICRYMDSESLPNTTLLYGVTSSGKTMLYSKLIERMASQGKGVLMLVPEIALATQMIGRLSAMFPGRVAILHSALSDSERTIQWNRIRQAECDIVVGTRSAVFAPMPNIGLIIMDEEQEGSYNSDNAPRYRASSVAAMRAKTHGAHLLLSSATPSVESYYRAQTGAINIARLTTRYGDMPLPKVSVCDMRNELIGGNTKSIGSELYVKIKRCLQAGEQCILLLNRRGYRTVTICRECGEVVMCDSCSMPMVWHKQDNTHRCHYCGKTQPAVISCPKCGGELRHTGVGTQKIEEELAELFPEANILRVDLDSVSRKNSMVSALKDFEQGRYDIMVGTQMIAKGLDFANVTLVGVLSVDSMLLMPSYRAFERTFDMLTQVVGRSGRGSKAGEAVIQTIDPQNPIIRMAAAQDYDAFYKNEIMLRKAHLYPPFCRMGTVCFANEKEIAADKAAKDFAALLTDAFKKHPEIPLRVLGPSPMRVSQVGGVYRRRILLKSRGDSAFRAVLGQCLMDFSASGKQGSTRVYVDFTNESET